MKMVSSLNDIRLIGRLLTSVLSGSFILTGNTHLLMYIICPSPLRMILSFVNVKLIRVSSLTQNSPLLTIPHVMLIATFLSDRMRWKHTDPPLVVESEKLEFGSLRV